MITLRELRLNAQMTQAQAAAAVGVAQPTYAIWETGRADGRRSTPPVAKLRPLSEAFGVPVDVILDALGADEEVG